MVDDPENRRCRPRFHAISPDNSRSGLRCDSEVHSLRYEMGTTLVAARPEAFVCGCATVVDEFLVAKA